MATGRARSLNRELVRFVSKDRIRGGIDWIHKSSSSLPCTFPHRSSVRTRFEGEPEMSRSSSSYNFSVKRIRGLPLIDCPACSREQLHLLQSYMTDNPGNFFLKCPRNEKGKKMPKDCTFFMWLE